MRSSVNIPSLCWLFLGVCCAVASADGGRIVLVEKQDNYSISVFTSPDPLRAGPIDISVLLQDATTEQAITDVEVDVSLTSRDGHGPTIRAIATSAAATNKLLSDALMVLPAAGIWDVEIDIAVGRCRPQVHFAIEAGQPLPHWLTVWPWFSWPAAAVVLFGIHRRLIWRKQSTRFRKSALSHP